MGGSSGQKKKKTRAALPQKKKAKGSKAVRGKTAKKMILKRPMRSPTADSFPIVGIGASAGGLEAFMELFHLMPPDTGIGFVLVQHLSPKNLSLLSKIVQKTTDMTVVEVKDEMRVEPNKVYIIPPNSILEILQGILSLQPMTKKDSTSRLIDTFFSSLARDHRHLSIGVILSGTGSDGSQGLIDIKAAGGISLVQEPTSAKYDSMPRMAIKLDHPDRVLPIAGLAKELVRIAQNPRLQKVFVPDKEKLSSEDEVVLRKIFLAVRAGSGTDFSVYKYPTILRRINRRMLLNNIETMKHYHSFLQSSPLEIKTLFSELIINVTHFFRDPEVFESLKNHIFLQLLNNRPEGDSIRIWVPGCSTGEEVYTIAISLLEYLEEQKMGYRIQIYGTDVGESIIKKARAGVYSEAIEKHVSKQRLDRFFVKDPDGYKIGKVVRDCCAFSVQDVTIDPPIHRLDLLSCRNLMIYLAAPAQQRLMETFFYALNSNGFLLLGSSESVGPASSFFSTADEKNKIYLKRTTATPPRRFLQALGTNKNKGVDLDPFAHQKMSGDSRQADPVSRAEKLVLEAYAPAWILVNQMMDIVHFKGRTDHLITPRSGQASLHLSKMLHEELVSDVRVLIHKVEKSAKPAAKNGIKLHFGKAERLVDLRAAPVGLSGSDPHYLVLFELHPEISASESELVPIRNVAIDRLREELVSTQTSLRSLLDDQSSANEELQSTNEEILSANEELQSTNEELETAKEETQSTNEELITVNEELSQRNSELSRVNDDLSNLLNSASIAVVMVNSDLFIRRITPAALKLLNLKAADIGRRLTDFNLGFSSAELGDKLNEVIQNLSSTEFEIKDRLGRHFSAIIRPYTTHDRRVDGAVIAFSDIDNLKQKGQHTESARKYANAIIQTMHDPLIVMGPDLKVSQVNSAFFKTFQTKPEETIGKSVFDLGNGQWNIPELRNLLEKILPEKSEVRDFAVTHHFKTIGQRKMLINAQKLAWDEHGEILILLAIRDVTNLQMTRKEGP